MPNHKSAIKRVKQNNTRYRRNTAYKSRCKSAIKNFLNSISNNKKEESLKYLKEAISTLDKARLKGVYHKNNIARKISRLMKRYNAMVASQQQA